MKILFAEDTKDLNRAVTVVLQHEQYEVDSVGDGLEAMQKIDGNAYDCIILDIMMLRMDGMQVLREVRHRHITTPVIMLTAKAEIDDRVAGLDAGADDYLPKPFAMKELLARVRAATRRAEAYGDTVLTYGDVTIDPATFALTARSSVRLSVKEYELMRYLMRSAEAPVDAEHVLGAVWRGDEAATANTVWLYVLYLRGKLAAVGSSVAVAGENGGPYRLVREA